MKIVATILIFIIISICGSRSEICGSKYSTCGSKNDDFPQSSMDDSRPPTYSDDYSPMDDYRPPPPRPLPLPY